MRVAQAPGKIIFSGEHAVVYGVPALATAVDLHVRMLWLEMPDSSLNWTHLQHSVCRYSLEQLRRLSAQLDQRYADFSAGRLPIQQVLTHPHQLLAYSLARAAEAADLTRLGGSLRIHSDLPLGAGMGSSAALIAAASCLLAPKLPLSERIELVYQCERLQHGRGSYTDAASVCQGGWSRVCGQSIQSVQGPSLDAHWYWIFTGVPEATTGECVEQVRLTHAHSEIWQAFQQVAEDLACAQPQALAEGVRQNQRLLEALQVVPEAVRVWVRKIEALGGAAKISGAGSIRGDAAGLLLAWMPEHTPADLNLPSEYRWGVLQQETQGAQAFNL